MRSIVTGGAGFIGSHLVDRLLAEGDRVTIVDDLSTGDAANISANAEFEQHDIRDVGWLDAFFAEVRPERVFHLAALPRIQPSFHEPVIHDDVNVRGTLNVLRAASRAPNLKAFVYASSSAVYGTPDQVPTPETAPIDPLSPYALQKYTAERYVHLLAPRHGVAAVSLRYFNPYGPRSFNPANALSAYSSVVGIFENQRAAGRPLPITGDGLQERDFVHVEDVAAATVLVADRIDECNGHVFNVGSGHCTSVLELAKMFDHPVEFVPERPGEARITQADATKLMQLGWEPRCELADYVKIRGES